MRNFGMFYLQVCFLLSMSAQFSDAGKVPIPKTTSIFKKTATIESFLVKEPNQNDFTKYPPEKQMLLGIHTDWSTFSFYESGASETLFTFQRTQVDFENYHSQSMSFRVEEENGIYYYFRVVFSVHRSSLDTIYLYLSFYTGYDTMNFRMSIGKVERYMRTGQGRGPIIQPVEDLQPAMFYYQKIEGGRRAKSKKNYLYKMTPFTPDDSVTKRKIPRLAFRTGSFKVGRVNDKVVLELSGFDECYYILHFEEYAHATTFLSFFYGAGHDVTLAITGDLKSYLESQASHTGPSADWEGKHSRDDQGSSRNVRARSDDETD